MSKKAMLMILDGWGIGNHGKEDVIYNTPTPYWNYLIKNYPNSQLQASGENVGFPTAKWEIPKWDTSISEPAEWFTRI
jgi:2,3-bisphosphoglycerate-independent phosphoglycerate mutase